MIIKCKANDKRFEVDGATLINDVAPLNINNRTYLPIRFIAENMGLNVDWNELTETVTISDNKRYFKTIDECAIDFYMHFNCASIALYREFGASVYESNYGYYWDNVKIGKPDTLSVVFYSSDAKNAVALLHTHGGSAGGSCNNTFSSDDERTSNKCKIPLYMCSPVGDIWIYKQGGNPPRKKISNIAPIDWKFESFVTDCGYKNYKTSLIYFNAYFNNKYKSIAKLNKYGYIADYYNNMFMQNIKY